MKTFIQFLFIILFCSSCTTYIPFTEELRGSLESNGIDLRKLQFYSTKSFVLKRNSQRNVAELQRGNLESSKTFIRETIKFRSPFGLSKLAGICKIAVPDAIGIVFEPGDFETKKIFFQKNNSGFYEYNSYTLIYDNQAYEVVEGNKAKLLVSANETKDYVNSRRKVKGLYVDDRNK